MFALLSHFQKKNHCLFLSYCTDPPWQDLIFGSEGTAQADAERIAEINREIGLNAALHHEPTIQAVENVEKADV